jgi:uncharacterized membrane protein YccC
MKWFSKSAVLFSLKTCFAAFLALYIALALNLDKPAWSIASVFIASQLYSASTLSKSVFRLLGTMLGGLFILLIYPATVQLPLLFSLCVSAWVALCLYLSLHDRTPRSYVFMLAGYSAAIMGFPDVTSPQAITYTVISRIEEIGVAIICSSLIHSLILPVSMSNILEKSITDWYDSAKKLCNALLTAPTPEKSPDHENILIQMAGYPANVEVLITHCIFEGNAARKLIRLVTVQYQHLSYLVPTLTSIELRLNMLAQRQIAFPENVQQTFRHFLLWLNNSDKAEDSATIQHNIGQTQTELQQAHQSNAMNVEDSLLLNGLLDRLGDFVRIAEANFSVGKRVDNFDDNKAKRSTAHWHIDKGMLLLSSFTAFLVTFLCCLFWIGSGWKDGATAPMMAAILCSFFAAMDNPVAPMKVFLTGVVVATAISIFYVSMLIPLTTTFEALVICLFPGLFVLGVLIANPATNLLGLIIATQIPGLISLGHHFKPDPLATLNGAISSLVGVLIGVVVTAIIRSKRPSWTARRALLRGIKELIQFLAEIKLHRASLNTRQRFVARMLDKVNVILPRKKNDTTEELASGGDLITEVWLGANYYDFHMKNQELLADHIHATDRIFYELKGFLKARLKSFQASPHPKLLREIDLLLIKLEAQSSKDARYYAPMLSLFNIRLVLFSRSHWPSLNRVETDM